MFASLRFTIPLPNRVPLGWTILSAAMLLVTQLSLGTSAVFAQLVFLFIVLSAVAVNLAGGLSRLGGFCIAVMSLKLMVISQLAKSLYGEPGDSRLEVPVATIGVLLAGLAGMTVATAFSRMVRFRHHLFRTDTSPDALKVAAMITFAIGSVSHLGVMATGVEDGALLVGGVPGLLRQLSFCLSLSVVFGTAYVIQQSNGARLLGAFNLVPVGLFFLLGVLAASKQGMFEPFLLIGLTAIAFGFRFSAMHLVLAAGFLVFAVGLLFPFGQVARNYTRGFEMKETFTATGEFAAKHLTDWDGFQQLHQQYNDAEEKADLTHYYEDSVGLLERVSLIKMVDLLVAATHRSGWSEWDTVTHGLKMALPRFLYPHKPAINTGTYLGKKAGVISEDDWGTQISFGFIADAFSAFGWLGAVLIPGVLTFFFFLLFNWFVGPLERNVWCIYFFAEYQHFFAEQTISAMTLSVLRRPIWLIAIYLLVRLACAGWRLWRAAPDGNVLKHANASSHAS